MSLVQIKVLYNYYSTKRVTPVYILHEELENFSFEEFKSRMTKNVPHLCKATSLRWTVEDDDLEVDLSPSYFNVQIRGILQKGNIIKVNAIQFESPAACTSSQNQEASSKCNSSKDHVAHRTQARRELLIEQAASTLQSIDEDSDTDTDNENEGNAPHIMLPLERYALKQRETVENIKHELQNGTRKLEQFDEKIRRASSQNAGGLSSCGNCHLKMGHTKKICTFSPCKFAFSCGNLSKHSSEKAERTAIEREIGRLRIKLNKGQKDIDDAKKAAEKLNNSVSKRIEEIAIHEMPDRYLSSGLRNWALLNRDVATLQKHLKGKLPSRENVQKLLNDIVITNPSQNKSSQRSGCSTTKASITCESDHRMSSQKRLLSEDYAITFPSKKASYSVCSNDDLQDFKLALKLQHEEMETMQPQTSKTGSTTHSCIDLTRKEETEKDSIFDPIASTVDQNEENLEFEADAAAALLQLKRRRSSSDHNQQKPSKTVE